MNYRKIYKDYHGFIPIDEDGRTYDIHHKDGNHANTDIDNLIALSIQEHYDIHHKQGDYGACYYILLSMKKTPEEMSEIISKSNKKRIENGTLSLLNKTLSKEWARKRTIEGRNPFTGGEIQRRSNNKRVKNGTHNFIGENSPAWVKFECPHCGKITNRGNLKRWHFNNCKEYVL